MPSGLVHTTTTIYAASHSSGYIYAFSRSTGILLQVLQASACAKQQQQHHCHNPTLTIPPSSTYPFPTGTSPNSLLGLALAPQSTFSGSSTDGSLFLIDATSGIKRVDSTAASCPATTTSSPSAAITTCADGMVNGEESDVDCGGRACGRCSLGSTCHAHTDCATSNCLHGICVASVQTIHTASFLRSYLNSDFYTSSFAHHMIHGA